MRNLSKQWCLESIPHSKEEIMDINGNHEHMIDVRLDGFTTLHIAERRINNVIMVVAECCRQFQDVRSFNNVEEICEHYHINNSDMRDSIARIVDFIDGKM